LSRGADLGDAPTADGEGLRDGEAVVDGDDLAVDENGVRRLRRSEGRRAKDCKCERDDATKRHVEYSRWIWFRHRRAARQPGSMPRFLKAAAAAGALAASGSFAPAMMPLANMVYCWISVGSGPI